MGGMPHTAGLLWLVGVMLQTSYPFTRTVPTSAVLLLAGLLASEWPDGPMCPKLAPSHENPEAMPAAHTSHCSSRLVLLHIRFFTTDASSVCQPWASSDTYTYYVGQHP